jgi:site-specific recombinase XerD
MTDKLPDVMTDSEWRQFIGTFNLKAPTGLRNAALFTLMHDAGLRTCEVIGLKTSDVRTDTVDGQPVTALRLETTKGGKERMVYLTAAAEDLLTRWLETKKAKGLGRFRQVFTTLKGGPLADAYLRELAARKGEQAGIGWRVHPHALRHTFATDLLEDTGDLALVQDALGHRDPETTRVYAKVRNSRLARAMAKRGVPAEEPEEPAVDALAAALKAMPAAARRALAKALLDGGE